MRKKLKITGIIAGVSLSIYVVWTIYRLFFLVDINVVPKEEYISKSSSPDQAYTIRFYRANGGATVDYAMLGIMENKNGEKRPRVGIFLAEAA